MEKKIKSTFCLPESSVSSMVNSPTLFKYVPRTDHILLLTGELS